MTDKDGDRKRKWEDNKNRPFQPNDSGEHPEDRPYGDRDDKR